MNLILIAGLPATGKSRFASYLQQSHDEKTKLNHAALESLYYAARQILAAGSSVILENNFEWYALPGLEQMIAAYGCEPITIFFGGDERVIYRRYVERNADPTRHRGHVLSTCYPEKDNIGVIPEPISLQEFQESFRKRGMSVFRIGEKRIDVDTTDFSKVDYDAILQRLRALMA